MAAEQPAYKSYFFGDGYTELADTIKEAWVLNIQSASGHVPKLSQYWEYGSGVFGKWVPVVFYFMIVVSIYVFGSMWTIATSLLHIAVLFSFFLLVYIGFSIVWVIDRVYLYLHKIKTACPNDNCQAQYLLPAYVCECGRKHSMLIPGVYGILKRRCLCGRRLPTTFLNGREGIKAVCSDCGAEIGTGGKATMISIPIIGGPSVGKSCFLNMAIDKIRSKVSPEKGWAFEYYSDADKMNHEKAMGILNAGQVLEKTSFTNLTAYKFNLQTKASVPKTIYIYDIAGEMFANSSDITSQKRYSYSSGFIFIIDPLSLGRFAMEKSNINIENYGVSSKDFNDILDIMLVNLEKMYNITPKDILKTNLAVVINKMDIPGLEQLIGDSAVDKYLASNPSVKNRLDAVNAVCEEFLDNYEAGNFVRTVKGKFKKVQYFECSSLGHNIDGNKFQPKGIEEPVLWMLEMIDSSFKN